MSARPRAPREPEPDRRVDRRTDRFDRCILLALFTHAGFYGASHTLLGPSLGDLLRELREAQRAALVMEADLEVAPPPEPEPEKPPEPPHDGDDIFAPEASPRPVQQQRVTPPPDPTPAPEPPPLADKAKQIAEAAQDLVAQAAKALTSDDAPADAPTVASGEGQELLYGLVAGAGKGSVPTFNPRAGMHAGPQRPRKAPDPGASMGPDRSRRAHVFGGYAQRCGFPVEAEVAGIDQGVAAVVVTVAPDGKPQKVVLVRDPGHGFGRAAYRCAFNLQYSAARDRSGRPIAAETSPFNIRFTR